ncbi:GH92 family glycosyl hydrolase [Maribacter polysaccharolyticus]|uniref:GH92 family glycosyl hydrolase n=1 Tax=Maribacter polysaccharolyticus TaxID=3020831 RepID=UPI00237F0384|nr:GH92 family glycosyl hydrolase [Maribacter polysaccharolyticus]MDE3742072.1 GH92 family glycosyl hydrolase [Maribacter polysaccharolyticus]
MLIGKRKIAVTICFVLGVLVMVSCSTAKPTNEKVQQEKQPVDYIDPIIGAITYGKKSKDAHGFGKTFPGAATPFGLVQLSPDTFTGGDNGSGYSYEHPTLEGFSFTHMSGVGWFGDLGNFLVTPTTGKLHTNRGVPENPEDGYRSRFSHDTEVTKAGYYAVTLADYKVKAELTAAPRAGIIRFTYPENDSSRIQIDLSRRVGGTSTEQYIRVVDENTIEGWMKCPPEGGGWGAGAGNADYVVYFHCQFSKPLKDYGIWSADIPDVPRKMRFIRRDNYQDAVKNAEIFKGRNEMQGKHLGFYTDFSTKEGEQVLVKSGISFVSIAGAKENLEHDIDHWDFDKTRQEARDLWSTAISNIAVSGATDREKTIFYTALYHTLIDPRAFSDVNGNYIGADKQVHQTDNFTYRTIFSGWDVFRSQFPLQTIINPALVDDEINSLLQMAALSGREYLPRWEMLNSYSGVMLGNPAVSVINDAYQKGIRNYDVEKAFEYSLNTVNNTGNGELGYSHKHISKTLEYAYSDWALATFAQALGKNGIAETYFEKSKNYKNIWNDEVNWFRAKDSTGTWLEWKGKTVHGQGCIESNPFQQGWFVPHDIDGLKTLMGGEEAFKNELITFFENTPEDFLWNNYYNHANEPVHHVPFMFNEAGVPHLTQKYTRKICDKAYGIDAYGLCGNEDVGQMSAWYVLASIGIHPINPGDNKYQITSPVFNDVEIKLDSNYYSGKTFRIIAHNNSKENIYIQTIKLNGKPLDRFWISHEEITKGGVLEFEMGPEPKI